MASTKALYILVCAISVIVIICGAGCANIVAPTGGPRDTLPPQLVAETPRDSTLHFNEKKITFYFDEFVNLDNVQQNLIVSPVPKINPNIEFKLRTVTVRIKDTLEPNTTYSINFGNAIRDINENNVLKNFTYVFATGGTIDKNRLTGQVLLAETGKVDTTLTVVLHRSAADSAVIKERPRYIAKVDHNGNFTFSYLPSGTFHLYVLKDEGGTHRYQSGTQLFGFAGRPVVVDEKTAPVVLYAYVETVEAPRKPAVTPAATKEKTADKRLAFQNNLEDGQQDLLQHFELQFTNPLKVFDTTQVRFFISKFQPVSNYRFTIDSLHKKYTLLYTWIPDSTYHLVLDKNFAEDSAGRKITKIDTITFKAKKETDYGSLRLRFTAVDLKRNPVLQLVQSDKIIYTHAFTTNEFYQKLVKPGEYEIRILYDDNRNGKWDAGVFFGQHRQPEIVQAVTQKVKVKANWDNDIRDIKITP